MRKLSEVISSYIKEVKGDGSASLSDCDIFQEVLSLSWPIANMDLRNASDNSSFEMMPEADSATMDKARVERINRSRLSLQKAWYDLAMSISKKSALNELDGNLLQNNLNENYLTQDDLPQCDQVQTLGNQGQEAYFPHHHMGEMPDLIGMGMKQNHTNQPSTSELNDQLGNIFHRPLSVDTESDSSKYRRQSLGDVNIGSRISYFESNAQQVRRQSRAKQ